MYSITASVIGTDSSQPTITQDFDVFVLNTFVGTNNTSIVNTASTYIYEAEGVYTNNNSLEVTIYYSNNLASSLDNVSKEQFMLTGQDIVGTITPDQIIGKTDSNAIKLVFLNCDICSINPISLTYQASNTEDYILKDKNGADVILSDYTTFNIMYP